MRLIDADALIDRINIVFLTEIGKIIDDSPTIDAVEVIRCKDCRWYDKDKWCRMWMKHMNDKSFCSGGKRRAK